MKKIKAYIVGIVTFLIFGFLFWEHFHGGVTCHYILNQQDLPSISNWWSGLLLPILTWFLLSRIEKRLDKQFLQTKQTNNPISNVFWSFLTGLVFGILLSTSFTSEYKLFLDNVPYILIVLSFIIPIFYSEFILGFILGMTYTFGAILPMIFILIIASLGFIIYRFIRPLVMRTTKVFGR
ncbi:hypothetical protein [Flavobacterium soyangense]|uniref:Uncharacterized protein n=1 Tax=Flavobacterium soyangense TaxID=2023265 RepID=A0A930U5E8_9FLAO|nr:hypothetical protein [Flavobacterium soyangense]MBF2707183.1 hypothetical protein [Flavobacterium soyangense]